MLTRKQTLQCPRNPKTISVAIAKLRCQLCWAPLVSPHSSSQQDSPMPHPCLFCEKCLQETAQKPTPCKDFTRRRTLSSASLTKGNVPAATQNADPPGEDSRHVENDNGGRHVRFARETTVFGERSPKKPEGNSRAFAKGEIILNDSLDMRSPGSAQAKRARNRHPGQTTFDADAYRIASNGLKTVPPGEAFQLDRSEFRDKLRQLELRATRCGFCPRDKKRETLVAYCYHCRKYLCPGCHRLHSTAKLYKHHARVKLDLPKNDCLT